MEVTDRLLVYDMPIKSPPILHFHYISQLCLPCDCTFADEVEQWVELLPLVDADELTSSSSFSLFCVSRNLYAKDFSKGKVVSKAEFEEIWTTLDNATRHMMCQSYASYCL